MVHSSQASVALVGLVMLLIGGAAADDCLGSGTGIMLKSVRSGNYLYVAAEHPRPRDPVVQGTSMSEGNQWQVKRVVGAPGCTVMLRNVRSGLYLHVASEHVQARDRVVQWWSSTKGSQWKVERVGFLGSKVMLTNVRSGLRLHVPSEAVQPRDPVVQWSSTSEGSQWEVLPLKQIFLPSEMNLEAFVEEGYTTSGDDFNATMEPASGGSGVAMSIGIGNLSNGITSETAKPLLARSQSFNNLAATIYEHVHWEGAYRDVYGNIINIGSSWNDKLSSLIIYPNWCITLYEHFDYFGSWRRLCAGSRTWRLSYVGDTWNDRVSSIRVSPRR